MAELNNANEIIDFAIGKEQEAADFYSSFAVKAKSPAMKATFEQFAAEEMGHKAKLQNVKAGKKLLKSEAKIQDLKIGDYLVEDEPSDDMDYQDALIIAMKAEKAAFRLYSDLAAKVDDAEIKNLLLGLAQEEAKHKLRFEIEYDDQILTEN